MSGPYRFGQERITSPLDQRPPNPFPSGQPVSFKTNINRNKTKKWVEAKPFSYDGDDWGDYDEDDEYGVAAHASQNPQAPTGLRQRGQSIGKGASRSFTEPAQAPAQAHARRPSFEYGEEKRAFSASLNHSQTLPVQPPSLDTSAPGGNAAGKAPALEPAFVESPSQQEPAPSSSAQPAAGSFQEPASAQSRGSSTSWAPSVVSDSSAYQDPQLRRDFSQSALPPPLQMRSSTTPTPTAPQETPSRFPPRKSSLSHVSPTEPAPSGDSAQSTPIASRQRAPSNPNKPLPFIRPADIYKRVEEERRKASMDSERPSLDSVTRPSEDDMRSPGVRPAGSSENLSRGRSPSIERYDAGRGQNLAPLETVAERKSEYLHDFSLAQAEKAAKAESTPTPAAAPPTISALPHVPVSSFGADFWDSAEKPSTASLSAQDLAEANKVLPQPEVGPADETSLHHQPSHGFRTAVRNAFERTDDNSVPPTPVSKSNSLSAGGSSVSRSNTDSTAGISPIMSRVPSGANPTTWKREMENATPAIAEEPSTGSRPASSGTMQPVQRKPSPSHSANGSSSSIPRIGTPTGRRALGTPSPNQSPARSPFIEAAKPVPAGESGELSGVSSLDAASPTNFATREADLVSSPSSSNKRTSANMGAEEKQAQSSFLEHRRRSTVESSPERGSPIVQAESPTKGRVRDLAGKFNDIVDSRRNSAHSISSLKSNGSGNKRFSRSPSPTKEIASERPQPEREVSFRPKLPGTWESYTTVGQPSPEKEKQEPAMEPLQERESTPPTKNSDALEETDITPTTTKRPVDHKDAVDPMHDPMGALAAAGAAIGESLKSAVAPGQRSPAKSEPESWEGSIASDDDQPKVEEEKKDRAVGDVYLRPLQLDRTASSVASSSGPPSPQRDGDREDYSPVKAPPPLRASRSPSIQPPELDTSGTAQAAPDDYSPGPDTSDLATDRLTADIMKRLSTPSLVGSVPDLNRTLTPQPPAQDTPKASQETRASAVVPSEYENYWAASGEEDVGGGSGHSAAPPTTAPESTIRAVNPEESHSAAGDSSSRPGFLSHKFSWEGQEGAGNAAAQASAPGAQAPAASEETASTAPVADSAHLAAAQNSDHHPSVARAIAALPEAPTRTSEGLHIVNPEPDLSSSSASPVELEAPAAPNQPLDADAWRAQTQDVDPPSSQPSLTPIQQPSAAGAQPRIPLFREILALKSTDERLAKYSQTREQFAGMDTGLRNWVQSTLATKPEHAELANLPRQPLPPIQSSHSSSGGGLVLNMRHKHNASISHFATGFRKTNQTAAGLESSSAAHASTASPTDAGQQGGAGRGGMQVKGKDLLKGAGVLGGKGMKEAKGLFAKGRSRFRGESKAFRNITPYDHPSSSNISAPPPAQPPSEPSTTDALPAVPTSPDDTPRDAAEDTTASNVPLTLPPLTTAEVPLSAGVNSALQSPATPLDSTDGSAKEREKKKRFSFGKLRQRSKSGSRSRPSSLVLDENVRPESPPPPPPPIPKDFAAQNGTAQTVKAVKDDSEENVRGEEKEKETEGENEEEKDERKSEKGEEGGDTVQSVTADEHPAVDTVDFGRTAGSPDQASTGLETRPAAAATSTPEVGVEMTQGQGRTSQDSRKDHPEMNVSKPVSRQISLIHSPAGSRPVSSVGSGSAQFVAPEEWESLPDPASAAPSPVNRSFNQSPVSRTGTPGRSFAERAQSPIPRSGTPGSITMPTSQYSESSQKNGRWERLGVLPSPNIEPLSWLDEKEKRRSLAAEQRMERVIESVVRNSTPVSVRSKGSAGSMGRIVGGEEDADSRKDGHDEGSRNRAADPAGESDNEEPVGGKSSRQSFAQRASSRHSIRTRGSRGSIASLLPVPLDEVARKSLTLEEHELDRPKFDVSPIDLDDGEDREAQLRAATSPDRTGDVDEEQNASQYNAPDAHAGAQRTPSPPTEARHGLEEEQHERSTEQRTPPRVSSPLQAISVAAASSAGGEDQRALAPPQQASAGAQASYEDEQGSCKYQVSPLNPEFDVPRQRPARENQGPRPFSYMEGQSTQEESLQQGYAGPRYEEQQAAHGDHMAPDSSMQRGMRYVRGGPPVQPRDPRQFQPPPPGLDGYGSRQGPYPQRNYQPPPPGMGEYGSQQGPRPMRQSYQSPPSGLAEARRGPPPQSANQGQGGFNQQDFDPRSYTSEFQLPGVGPPDHSESSELRQKRRSILGNIGSNKATPSGSNTPASKSSERVNERINPQHVDQQLHRTFSYQSSFNEQQMIKGGKGQEKQGEDVLEQMAKATDPTQKRQKSKIFSPFKRSDTSSQQLQQQQEPTAADHARFATPPPESTTPPVAPSQLKKGRNVLQRNASSGRLPEGAMATEKKEKKKRTSLLGSIFGRSMSSSNISKEEKQREKEEKKLRKTQSKGKLSKLQKANLTQPPVPEARSAAYAPVPDPSASFQGPNDAVQGTITEEPQSDMYAPDDQKPPVSGPGYPPGLQQPPPQSGYPGPGYPPPGPAMYSNGNGFGPHPPRAQPAAFRHRYYQQPQRALSQDRALYPNPPMPYPQQRRFSEQMQPYPPRAYQTPPPQQFRHPSAGSVHGSDYGAHLSPQVSAMTPPQPGQLVRQGTGDEMIVSPVTSRTGSSGPSEAGYFGPQQRGSPGRRTSDPFERQRMWYQQQAQQQQMMQQRRMGPITEHHPTPPPQHQQGSRPYPQAPWNVQHFPDHQQQRPYELSLPGADSDNDDSIGDDQQQRRPAPEKDEPAWSPASAGAYREVLPRGYPTATTSSPPHMYQPTSSPYPPIPRSSPYPPPPSSTSPPPHFSAADASRFPLPPSGSTTTSHTPSPTALRIEPRWKEVSPEEGEAELERLRDRHAQQQLAAQESVHPAYRHSPNPSVSGGNNNGSPRVPPGFEGASAHKRVASGELRMDPAYAKEYGIGTGKHGQEEEDDDDDEDLYAEPTYRSEESGRQGAMALEAAHSEAGESTPSPPTVAVGMAVGMAVGKEGEGARSRDEDEEAVVMHGASYPGMEWTPRWDGGVE